MEWTQTDGGVSLVYERMEHARSTAIGIWLPVGTRHEQMGEEGLAHFLEHMVFKGTEALGVRELARAFDRIGAEVEAYTARDRTCFSTVVLDHHAARALELLATLTQRPAFSEAEMEKEKHVVLEEQAMVDDQPDDLVAERLWRAAYGTHPLGAPILGTPDSVRRFSRADLRSFHERHYASTGCIVAIAGSLEPALLHLANALFSAPRETPVAALSAPPAFQAAATACSRPVEQAHLALAFPGFGVADERRYALAALDSMLGGSLSSRLFQSVREELGLAYSISSWTEHYADAGAFGIYGATAPGRLPELEEAIQRTVAGALSDPFSGDELAIAKEQLAAGIILAQESTVARMEQLAHSAFYFGRLRPAEEVLRSIAAVDERAINAAAEAVLSRPCARSVVAPS